MTAPVRMFVGGRPWDGPGARQADQQPADVPALHPAIGGSRGNRFCGPGALAILTGKGTDEAAAAIRAVTGKRNVFGVMPNDLWKAGQRLGLTLLEVAIVDCQGSLRAWAARQQPGRYLVTVTNHYVVARVTQDGIEVGDNQSVYPVPLAKFRRAGKRVQRAWKVL